MKKSRFWNSPTICEYNRQTNWSHWLPIRVAKMPDLQTQYIYMLTLTVGYYDYTKDRLDWMNEVDENHPNARSYGFPYKKIASIARFHFPQFMCPESGVKHMKSKLVKGLAEGDPRFNGLPSMPFWRPRSYDNMILE